MSWLEHIIHWDQMAFLQIHDGWSNDFFDAVLPPVRNPFFWIPVYLILLVYSIKKFGRIGVFWILAFLLVFAITDFTAASILKPAIARLRPCNDVLIQPFIHHLVNCGSGFSFPSAHSSNHFGMSFFIIFTLGKTYKWMVPSAWIWAVLIVFAQVYVGVHYPLDILGGFILGLLAASLVSYFFNRYVSFEELRLKRKQNLMQSQNKS